MHVGEIATAQLLENNKVVSVRLRSKDDVEDIDEFGLTRYDGVDDALKDRGVSVVKDLSSSAALNQVLIVGISDSDDVNFRGHKDLNRYKANERGSAVHDEGLIGRRCSDL